jgi:YfiH family protein
LQRRQANGLTTYHFELFPRRDLVHAVFTRLGGVSQEPFATLNVGNSVGDDEAAVAENHARVYDNLNLAAGQTTSPHQVHGSRVARIDRSNIGQIIASTDGLVTNVPGAALLLRFADCQPIILYDPVNHALGLIHAGWRGVAQAIARRAVEAMQETYDSRPEDILAGLGPAIGPCCYTVGHNVAAAMGYVLPDWRQVMSGDGDRWRFDLSAANTQLLSASGVEKVDQAGLCTACHVDEFFSHRGENGRTGRFAVVAYLQTRDDQGERPKSEIEPVRSGPKPPTAHASIEPPGLPSLSEHT